MTAEKTLLYLTDGGLCACTWRNGALTPMQDFSGTSGMERFADFIGSGHRTIHFLADLVEEDFRTETVPHLPFGEQAELAQRRLAPFHGSTPFRRAERLYRHSDGRRGDVMSCSALTRPERIASWLDILLSRQAPLAGIHSAATVSAALSRHLDSGHALLLSWGKRAGLRLSCFERGHLLFSRLVPAGEALPPEQTIAEETARTRQYLIGTGLVAPEREIDVCLLCCAHDRAEMETRLHSGDGVRYVFLDLDELAHRAGLKTLGASSDATPLLLHLTASAPPRAQYAGPAHTRFFRLRRLSRFLHVSGVSLLALSLAWSAAGIIEADRLTDAIRLAGEQASQLERRARRATVDFDALPATPAGMKEAVTLWQAADRRAPAPQVLLSALGETLLEQPPIRLERLSWETAAQSIALEVGLEPAPDSYRHALDQIERFRRTLAQRGCDARILSPQDNVAEKRLPRFSLQLHCIGTA